MLLAETRSEDGIIHATRIDPRHIKTVKSLPSVAEMQAFLRSKEWTCGKNVVTMTIQGTWRGIPASTSGYTLPGAWRKFYVGVKAGTLP